MKQRIITLFIGILFTILFIAVGLSSALFFPPFYELEIDRLDIVSSSGYSKEEILENYQALMDYCSPFSSQELTFPTFPASESGLQHFVEVKQIFQVILIGGFLSLPLLGFLIYQKKKAKEFHYLRSSALIAIILPLFVMIAAGTNFDLTFELFHKLVFRNDFWIFSPETDPVIKILPQQFFFDSAILIALTILLGSIVLEILYRLRRKASREGISQR